MSWKAIVAGIDDSPEGVVAATVAVALAKRAATTCHLVHVAPNVGVVPAGFHTPTDFGNLQRRVADQARIAIERSMAPHVPEDALEHLEIWLGKRAEGLNAAARAREAGLIVLGRKRHSRAVRWLGGSTAHNLVRTADVPLLMAHQVLEPGLRVLAAVDLTYATGPTLELARRFADALDGQLAVLHVAEPLPLLPDPGLQMDEYAHFAAVEEEFDRQIRGVLNGGGETAVMRRGHSSTVVREVAREQEADLVVVGSHGKNWSSRVIVGSTTERLVTELDTALVVVPVRAPKATSTREFSAIQRAG